VTLSGDPGIYDLDLYLDGEVARVSSFIMGSPTLPAQRLLQADDFDRYRDKWGAVGRVEGGPGEFKIDDGRAVMTLTGSTGQVLKRSGKLFTDAIVEVDTAPLEDSEAPGFGIAFRCKDDRNFYAFVINPKGQLAIFSVEGGKLVWKRYWTTEAPGVIRRGAAANRLRVLGDGSLVRLYVNGYLVGALDHIYRDEGQAGILVLGQGKPRGQVAFTKWRVWSLAERYELAPEKAPWARFALALPGRTTVAESLQRLGEPYLNYKTSVVEDEIDAMEEPSVLDLGVYDRAKARGVNVSEVRVLLWGNIDHGLPIATFVFRGDKLWYAKYPSSPTETTPEQLASRYGKDAKTTTLHGRHGDVFSVLKLYSYPAQGLSFTQVPDRRIENKLVFPPSAELPLGLR